MPLDKRWQANILGYAKVHSELLRRGLADTLALIGSYGNDYLLADGRSAQDYANEIVKRLLRKANEDLDGLLWASLQEVLPQLSEAAPDIVLEELEIGLTGDNPILGNLFIDQEEFDPLFASSPHTGLLWALELLAWNPTYLVHSALILSMLDTLDPGGRLTNRPINSLKEIFLPWHPQTTASIDNRLRVIDTLRERYPLVAWRLLIQLLPQPFGSAMNTTSPQWRDWKPDEEIRVTYAERFQVEREIGSRLLIDAGIELSRWQDLIGHLSSIPAELHDDMINQLLEINVEELGEENATALYETLREQIAKHRHFRNARWALPNERIDRFEEVYKRFVPANPVLRHKWLFSSKAIAIEFDSENWEDRENLLAKARQEAAEDIYKYGEQKLIIDISSTIELPRQLGLALGQSGIFHQTEKEFLTNGIDYDDINQKELALGYVIGRFSHGDWEWAEDILTNIAPDWSPDKRGTFLLGLPRTSRTWNWAEQFGTQTEQIYWQHFNPFGLPEPSTYLDATRKLIGFNNPDKAISLLGNYIYRIELEPPPELVADVLEIAARIPVWNKPNWNILAHDMIQLLDYIEESKSIDERRLATLEWMYLPLFEYEDRPAKLLHSALSNDPDFFVEVITWVYRSEDEEPHEVAQEESLRAMFGDKLLRTWRIVPGTLENGGIDGKLLTDWIIRARKEFTERGRIKVADHAIGKILVYGPHDSDGLWPCRPIRDLIETISSRELEQGFEVEVYNRRGAYSKDPLEGGQQERELAETYFAYAKSIEDSWPRTAAMLRRIATEYTQDARREDLDAELREDLLR